MSIFLDTYQGERLDVIDTLGDFSVPDVSSIYTDIRLRNTAASQARAVMDLREVDSRADFWRHGVLQVIDFYDSYKRLSGLELAMQTFSEEPPMTGIDEVDAGLAALADYLARRDGWQAPQWAFNPVRVHRVQGWRSAPVMSEWLRSYQEKHAVPEFAKRGIIVDEHSLTRI